MNKRHSFVSGLGITLLTVVIGIIASVWPEFVKPHPYILGAFGVVGVGLVVFGSMGSKSDKDRPASQRQITQNMTNSPGAMQAGRDINFGTIEPPRVIKQFPFEQAINLLRTSPSGSSVGFRIVGGDEEINSFAKQIVSLFAAVPERWTIHTLDRIGSMMSHSGFGINTTVSHGDSLHYTSGDDHRQPVRIALAAIAAAGFTCLPQPGSSGIEGTDVFITIGKRT